VILNAHSYYSLRYGVLSEKKLLDTFKSLGYDFATLTDINNTSLAMSFINHAKKEQMKPIIGIDFRNGTKQQFIGLAKTNKGFEFLNRFLSKHLTKDKQFESRALKQMRPFLFIHGTEKVFPGSEKMNMWAYNQISYQNSNFQKFITNGSINWSFYLHLLFEPKKISTHTVC
jgi:DNA polymerase III alpha subunit